MSIPEDTGSHELDQAAINLRVITELERQLRDKDSIIKKMAKLIAMDISTYHIKQANAGHGHTRLGWEDCEMMSCRRVQDLLMSAGVDIHDT